jgi:hypothetical protein
MVSGNQCDNRADARPDERGKAQTSGLPFELACGMACVRTGIRPDAQGDAQVEPPPIPQGAFCEYGLSALQINVLALVHKAGARITPYERLSRQLMQEFGMSQSTESVRGVANRLANRGFLRRKQAREGTIRGVRFTIVETMVCPHIASVQAAVRCGVRGDTRPGHFAAPSILEEIDRKNTLSVSSGKANREATNRLEVLTEDDLAFHWPNLAKVGFGTCQLRQIVERLSQVAIGTEKVMQSLTHAEWELEHGTMCDKSGAPIASPVDWVFTSLSKNGYYRRPAGYVSPQEQAERDAAEEAKQVATARDALQKATFDVWLADLSPEERTTIITPQTGKLLMPEDTALRLHFKAQVWPEIVAKRKQGENNHEA